MWVVGQRKTGGLTRCKPEVAAGQHFRGQAGHDLLGLYVEVAIELVRAPVSHEADAIGADACAQECHRATRAGGARTRDIGGLDSRVRVSDER